jgi:hypothetical protein
MSILLVPRGSGLPLNDGINTEIYAKTNADEGFTTYRIDFLQADTLSPITVEQYRDHC